jgi:hypothetical protein
MKNRVSVWLILVLLVGSPTLAYALDISGTFAVLFEALVVVLMPVVVLILAIALIYKFVKRRASSLWRGSIWLR